MDIYYIITYYILIENTFHYINICIRLGEGETCRPMYQLECGLCRVRLEKVCLIEVEERLVQSEVYQCRNISTPGCEGGTRTKCAVR